MSQNFQTQCADIDLSGTPWDVKQVFKMWFKYDGTDIKVYRDSNCTTKWDDPAFEPPQGVSCGLYFYLSSQSVGGWTFNVAEPIIWGARLGPQLQCPGDVTYGKIRSDEMAFSVQSKWSHPGHNIEHEFNVQLEKGGNVISSRKLFDVDPTIIEKGDDPPGYEG